MNEEARAEAEARDTAYATYVATELDTESPLGVFEEGFVAGTEWERARRHCAACDALHALHRAAARAVKKAIGQ